MSKGLTVRVGIQRKWQVGEKKMRGTSGPICHLLPSLTDSWGGSLAESVLYTSLMMQDKKHLLKKADGRIKSPQIDVHEGQR